MILLLFIIYFNFYTYCLEKPSFSNINFKGVCDKSNFIFSFNDTIGIIDSISEHKKIFNLLIDKDIVCKCKVNRIIESLNIKEIICIIDNYSKCSDNSEKDGEFAINKRGDFLNFRRSDKNKDTTKMIELNAENILLQSEENKNKKFPSKKEHKKRKKIEETIKDEIENKNGKIIKYYNENGTMSFNITDNILNKKNDIIFSKESFELEINILNKVPSIKANCYFEVSSEFNITCTPNIINTEITIEDEIIIPNNPEETDSYTFLGFENKRTLTLKAGFITIKALNNKEQFYIINNKFISELDIELTNERINTIINNDKKCSCSFVTNELIDNQINMECIIEEKLENDLETISIKDELEPILLSDKSTTINFINFKGLSLYKLRLVQILKGNCVNNSYQFKLLDTEISSPLPIPKSLKLEVNINEEEKKFACGITNGKEKFDMTCKLDNYCPPENKNYEINITKESYYDYDLLKPDTIYIEIPNDLSTYTLISGYIFKENCVGGKYIFSIYNNFLENKEIGQEGELSIKLYQFEQNANCITKEKRRILCNVYINESNETEKNYCSNINKDIKIDDIVGDKYFYDKDNNLFHLYGFKGIESNTIEAGDLIKGKCDDDNAYIFTFVNSIMYYNFEEEIEFDLYLALPQNLKSSKCIIPPNSKGEIQIDIKCKILGENSCPIFDDKLDLIVDKSRGPVYPISNSQRIIFKNYIDKSTNITIKAKIIKKEKSENKTFLIIDSSNDYFDKSFLENLEFHIKIIFEKDEKEVYCIFKEGTIKCDLGEIDSDYINIEIKDNPIDNDTFSEKKTIIFTEFKGMKLYTLSAGKIKKGNCVGENNKTYSFSFDEGKSIQTIESQIPFYLEMEKPKDTFICYIKLNDNKNEINCTREGYSKCLVDLDKNFIEVGKKDPEPIFLEEQKTNLYFTSFANQSTYEYKIKVGPLIKAEKIEKDCKYHFGFMDTIFEDINYYTKEIIFTFNININDIEQKANCTLSKDTNNEPKLSCYFILDEEMCKNEILDYDLKINDFQVEIQDSFQNIIFEGFEDLETITVKGGIIKEKKIEDDTFIFIIKDNENIEKLEKLQDTVSFSLNYDLSESNFDANCIIENKNIICKSNDKESLCLDKDIEIKNAINYMIINNKAVYFINIIGLKTFTVTAG